MRHVLTVVVATAVVMTACSGTRTPSGPEATDRVVDLVVDTDVGSDDIMALLYLAQRPDVRLRAVTVSGTGLAHCEAGVRNVLALLELADASDDIPIACGRETPGPIAGEAWTGAFPAEWRSATDDLYGISLPQPVREPTPSPADEVIMDALDEGGVSLLALGPLTNVSDALADPDTGPKIDDIVIMGGALHVPGNVPETSGGEYNVWADPAAADTVFRSAIPVTLVPLDASNHVPVTSFFADALADRHGTPEADMVWRLFEAQPYLTGGTDFFWDPLAAVVATGSVNGTVERRHVEVLVGSGAETGSLVERPDGASVDVVLDVDADAFEREFLGTLAGEAIATPLRPAPDITIELSTEGCVVDGAPTFERGTVVVAGASASGSLGEAVLVRFGEGGSFERMNAWLAKVGSPAGAEIPRWIRIAEQMTLAPGADALAAWRLAEGHAAIACLIEPGVVLSAVPLDVVG
jgi:pyrimidine-specific ribonucleoside hydrolase